MAAITFHPHEGQIRKHQAPTFEERMAARRARQGEQRKKAAPQEPQPAPQIATDPICVFCGVALTARRTRLCLKRGDSPHCAECARAWRQTQRHQEELERSYEEARLARQQRAQAEYEAWREERYRQRLAEQEEQERRPLLAATSRGPS